MGAQPLPGQKDFRLPFELHGRRAATAGRRLEVGAPPDGDARAVARFDTTRQVQALSFSDNAEVSGPVVFAGYGLVVPEIAGLRLRQLRRPRREGQGRRRAALLPRGRRSEDADASCRATPICATRRCRPGSAAPGRCWWSPGRARPNAGETDPDELRHRARRLGHRRRQHLERCRQSALRRRDGPDARRQRRRRSTPATRTRPVRLAGSDASP